MCYSASAVTDIELSGTKLATAGSGQGFIKDTLCCGYGSDGMKESGKHDNIWGFGNFLDKRALNRGYSLKM